MTFTNRCWRMSPRRSSKLAKLRAPALQYPLCSAGATLSVLREGGARARGPYDRCQLTLLGMGGVAYGPRCSVSP